MNTKISTHSGKSGRFWRMLPAILMLGIAILACNMPLGGPTAPTPRPVSSGGAGGSSDWRKMIENAKPGDKLTVTLTEADLTEILADAIASNPDMNIQNPRVVLTNGIMQVYGQASMDVVTANFRVDLNVNVKDGKPQFEVASADFGGVPVPESMRQTLTQNLNQSFQNAIRPASDRFRVDEINITEGQMKVNGTVQ